MGKHLTGYEYNMKWHVACTLMSVLNCIGCRKTFQTNTASLLGIS